MSTSSATLSAHTGPTDALQRSAARRLRFREAVTGLASKAQSADLLRWIVLPGAIAVVAGFNFMLLAWVGASSSFREIEQIPYLISGGLMGLALVFLGGLLLASAFWLALVKKLQEESEGRFREHSDELEERIVRLVQATSAARANGRVPQRSRRTPLVADS